MASKYSGWREALGEDGPVLGRSKSYDAFCERLAKYPKQQHDEEIIQAMYCALGLVGEAGEVSEKIKKWHRDGKINREDVAKELGDVLYYLTRLATHMNYTLDEIIDMNMAKLTDRAKRGKLHGSGDNR